MTAKTDKENASSFEAWRRGSKQHCGASFLRGDAGAPVCAPDDERRFWQKVERRSDRDCWIWTAGRDRYGYGKFKIWRRDVIAHRLSAAMSGVDVGAYPLIRHTCDNRLCVNPAHLVGGTHSENSRDARERGRCRSRHGNARLIRDQLLTERHDRTAAQHALKFGIGITTVKKILRSAEAAR